MSSRTTRTFWVDARFLIGLALVVLSIVGVWFVISAARATTPVAVASRAIVPGAAVTSADVRWVDVALGEAQTEYVTRVVPDTVATRAIREGELIAHSSVALSSQNSVTTVVISSAVEIASSVAVGDQVEVWVTPKRERGVGEAAVLVPEATVAGVRKSKGLASSGVVTLEVVVPRAHVSGILDAQASQSALWVVPIGAVH